MTIYRLLDDDVGFPSPISDEVEEDGLLAVGGDLSPQRLLNAYRQGIFPWFNSDDPLLWWSPPLRAVVSPAQVHCSRSTRKSAKRNTWTATFNRSFDAVIDACRTSTAGRPDTWIDERMVMAYKELHQLGWCHSVEVWEGDELVGGLYGIAMFPFFCGESMFSRSANASKFAFYALSLKLSELNFEWIDCQMPTPHLSSLGVEEIDRNTWFNTLINTHVDTSPVAQLSVGGTIEL